MKINLISYNTPLYFTSHSGDYRNRYRQQIKKNTISETGQSSLQTLANRFAQEGLTYKKCIAAAKKNPFMIVQKPETMEKNITGAVKRFSTHGITVENYLKSALKNPILFSLSPDTVEKNMKKLSQLLAYDGMSVEDLFKCAQLNPAIYYSKPSTLNKNLDKIANGTNSNRNDIIELIKKQPTIISTSPQQTIKKYKLLKYIEENKYFDADLPIPTDDELKSSVLRKSFTNSIELDYVILLRNKLANGIKTRKKIPFLHIKDNVTEYIKNNSNRTFDFNIPDGEFAKEFTKFVKNFSKSVVSKNIFRIKTV